MAFPIPETIPVTDDEADAPDGSVVWVEEYDAEYRRSGDTWYREPDMLRRASDIMQRGRYTFLRGGNDEFALKFWDFYHWRWWDEREIHIYVGK